MGARVGARRLGTLLSSTASSLSYLATGVALVISARLLAPSSFGLIASGFALATFISSLGNLSLGYVAHHVATTEPQRWRSSVPWVVTGATLLCSLALLAVLLAVWASGVFSTLSRLPSSIVVVSFVLGPFLALETNLTPLMAAGSHLFAFNSWRLVGRVLTVVLTVAVGSIRPELWLLFLLHLLGPFMACVVGYAKLLHATPWAPPDGPDLRRLGKGIAILHPAAVGGYALTWFNILLVTSLSSTEQAGFYLTAWTVVQVILTVPQGAMASLLGHVAIEGPDAAWRRGRGEVWLVFVLCLLAMGLSWWLVEPLVPLVFGASYAPVVDVFRVLVFIVPGASMGLLMTPQFIGRGWFAAPSIVTLTLGILSASLCLVFVPIDGARGASLANVIAYIGSLLVQVVVAIHLDRRTRAVPSS